jgi:hypothetical protein
MRANAPLTTTASSRNRATLGGSPWLRRHIRQSQSNGSFLSKIPVDATAITHDPGDALAEDGLPQHELKPRPPSPPKVSIMATAAAEVSGADYYAANMFADAGLLKGAATGLPSAANSDDRLSLQSGKFHAILAFVQMIPQRYQRALNQILAHRRRHFNLQKQTIPRALLPRTSEIIEDRR